MAFSTAYDMMKNLELVHNRRKAFIYVSNGYDFDPFSDTRAKNRADMYRSMTGGSSSDGSDIPDQDPFLKQGNLFAGADLAAQLSELTRAANRANTTIYTIDPRGLVGGPDLYGRFDMVDANYSRPARPLRVIPTCRVTRCQSKTSRGAKRIDHDTSDYYGWATCDQPRPDAEAPPHRGQVTRRWPTSGPRRGTRSSGRRARQDQVGPRGRTARKGRPLPAGGPLYLRAARRHIESAGRPPLMTRQSTARPPPLPGHQISVAFVLCCGRPRDDPHGGCSRLVSRSTRVRAAGGHRSGVTFRCCCASPGGPPLVGMLGIVSQPSDDHHVRPVVQRYS